MKVIMTGSHLCIDTLEAIYKFREHNIPFEYVDISASLDHLKDYLKIRENDPMYQPVRADGYLGIPLFTFDDGTKTLDLQAAIDKLLK